MDLINRHVHLLSLLIIIGGMDITMPN